MSEKIKRIYDPKSLTSFRDIIENDISLQALEFQFEAPKHDWPIPYGEFLIEMFKCLDDYVENNNIEPIQELSTQMLNSFKSGKLVNKYMAFVNLQLAQKLINSDQVNKAMRYYKRGITLNNIKSKEQLKEEFANEFLSPRTKRFNEDKKTLLPVAEEICKADVSNILAPIEVARLARELLNIKTSEDTIKKHWLSKADPRNYPAIVEQIKNNNYQSDGKAKEQKTKLINLIKEKYKT